MSDSDNPQQPNPYGEQPTPYGEQPTAPYGQRPYGQPSGQRPSYGGQPGYGTQPSHGYGQQPDAGAKGIVGALFDLSFSTFVTPKIIKVVYVIGLVVIALGTVFFAFSGFFGDEPALGVLSLVIAPIVGFLYLCLFRMMCEFYLAITRMSEDINRRLPGR
jgi:hypothetical protein